MSENFQKITEMRWEQWIDGKIISNCTKRYGEYFYCIDQLSTKTGNNQVLCVSNSVGTRINK